MSDLEIFNLSISLARALQGEREAIGDLKLLLNRHPEMFENIKDLRDVISEVVSEPEIIRKNPKAKSEHDYMSYKQISDTKMGDVGIRNDNGTNVIYHANKKRLRNIEQVRKNTEDKENTVDGRGVHSPYTQAQSLDGRLVDNNISSTDESIISKNKEILTENLNKTKNIHDASDVLTNIFTQTKDINFTLDIAKFSKYKLNPTHLMQSKLKQNIEHKAKTQALFKIILEQQRQKDRSNGRN